MIRLSYHAVIVALAGHRDSIGADIDHVGYRAVRLIRNGHSVIPILLECLRAVRDDNARLVCCATVNAGRGDDIHGESLTGSLVDRRLRNTKVFRYRAVVVAATSNSNACGICADVYIRSAGWIGVNEILSANQCLICDWPSGIGDNRCRLDHKASVRHTVNIGYHFVRDCLRLNLERCRTDRSLIVGASNAGNSYRCLTDVFVGRVLYPVVAIRYQLAVIGNGWIRLNRRAGVDIARLNLDSQRALHPDGIESCAARCRNADGQLADDIGLRLAPAGEDETVAHRLLIADDAARRLICKLVAWLTVYQGIVGVNQRTAICV